MLRAMRLLVCSVAAAVVGAASGDLAFVTPARAQASVAFATSVAPPPLPAYSQATLPGPGYIWVPGYWAWDREGYYWTPGAWAHPPAADMLWTPGYWAWNDRDRDYVFHSGYWAPTVGYYGGIDYGFGYTGAGYHGGFWRNHQFVYNRAVNDLGNVKIATYANQVFAPENHISYNGGAGGTTARPTPAQLAAGERHIGPTPEQIQNQQTASRIPTQRYSENKGAPPVGAVARENDFRGANTSLPIAHTVSGSGANGPLVDHAQTGKENGQSGPVAPTGVAPNFAQHPVTIRSPTTAGNSTPGPAATGAAGSTAGKPAPAPNVGAPAPGGLSAGTPRTP